MTESTIPKFEDLVDLIHLENWDTLEQWINYEFKENNCQYLTIWLVVNSFYIEAITLVEYFGDQIKFSEQFASNGFNILHCLIAKKRIQENLLLFKIILENEYLDINQERIENNQPQRGETPLIISIINFEKTRLHEHDTSFEQLLLEHGANPNLRIKSRMGPLEHACSKKSLALVQTLLSYGADPTYSYQISNSLEYESCLRFLLYSNGNLTPNPDIPLILKELINAGATIHDQSFPLIVASFQSKMTTLETLEILLNEGYPINQLDQENQSSALMYSTQRSGSLSNLETVKFLVDHGAEINLINPTTGKTCLHYALNESEELDHRTTLETVEYLVNCGADLTIQDAEGFTPLATYLSAKDNLSIEMLYFLLKKSPPKVFDLKTNDGRTIQDLVKAKFAKDDKIYDGFFNTLIQTQTTNQPIIQSTQTINQTDPFDQFQCSFCLDELHINTCAIRCGHRFHTICIADYLEKANNSICPICRTPC